MPKRLEYGSTWGRFAKEEENSIDALFLGSSIAYCNVIPSEIWNEAGVSSYVLAGSEQTIPISYYYLRQASKTQSPRLVFLEVTGVFFQQYQDYTKVNIGYMPRGIDRLSATLFAAEPAERMGLFFPLYNYHSRILSLEESDIEIAFYGYPADDLAGYTFLEQAANMDSPCLRGEVLDRENYDKNLKFLGKIAEFCDEQGILPVFYIAPTYWRLSDEHAQMLEEDVEKLPNVQFFDFNKAKDLPYLDPEKDWFDLLHFNYRGAEKFSAYLGKLMINELQVSPSREADSGLWNLRYEKYQELKSTAG
ncbi:MAG: hypothetical protein GX025_04015 [Clostridiales bacterium]|nr:hypothetical protein [Clostridiales bacterium]